MLKYLFKSTRNIKGTFYKVALMLFFIYPGFFSFGKSYDDEEKIENDNTSIIFVSDEAMIYDNGAIYYGDVKKQKDYVQQEIIIFGDAIIYDNNSNDSIKIPKLNNQKRTLALKNGIDKTKKIKVNKTAYCKKSIKNQLYCPLNGSSVLSGSINNTLNFLNPVNPKFYFAESEKCFFLKDVINITKEKVIIYKNPSTTISYFSGQYSVRPPTFFI